jgi:transposase
MTTRYFGMDVHKDYVVVAAVDASSGEIVEPVRVDMPKLKEWIDQHLTPDDEVALEVSSNAWHVYDLLAHQAGQVVVSNPAKTRLIAQACIKTDKFDALALARLLASGFICDIWVPVSKVREQRALAAHRQGLRKQSTQVKNRIHALLRRHDLRCPTSSVFSPEGRAWIESLDLSPIEALERQQLLAQLELARTQLDEANTFIAQRAQYDPRVTRLMQITGIGFFTAFSVLAAIGDIHRFPSPKHLASYAGLVPSVHQSGQKHFTGHITKAGPPLLRWLMVEAAHIAIRWDPHWQAVYQSIAKRRGNGVAMVAVARKLLVVIWHLLTHEVPYRYLNSSTFTRKLKEWARVIGSENLLAENSRAFVAHQLQVTNDLPLISRTGKMS